ncbi:hypothetical protein JO972_16550 [Verrucomicrobiaceae bacterium 5K15]|uniref:Uncharacterized protein n=1 Tax=Oceaniferula flava TaxID=2800421 RepID=A0AAE2SFU2_9BACT|nr:hypothetical protein [Oceaniferula flavus]MBK1856582.1 hypothetical protein [Oceaniferula flavus]MBM1137889.1 hypothetical protein [Oceaniferula flavus]
MNAELTSMREAWIQEAVTALARGRGHLGVINMLRSYGMNSHDAKKVSFDIFDAAKARLRKLLRWKRLMAWSMIALPFILLIFGYGNFIVTLWPLFAGITWLYKLPNPSRLPEEKLS